MSGGANQEPLACLRCKSTAHTPRQFLLQCCRCKRAWHHPCHIPPITEADVLQRIVADEESRPADGLGSWVCRRCSKRPPVAGGLSATAPLTAGTSTASATTADPSNSRGISTAASAYATAQETVPLPGFLGAHADPDGAEHKHEDPTGVVTLGPSQAVTEDRVEFQDSAISRDRTTPQLDFLRPPPRPKVARKVAKQGSLTTLTPTKEHGLDISAKATRPKYDTREARPIENVYATPSPSFPLRPARHDTHDIADMYATPTLDPRRTYSGTRDTPTSAQVPVRYDTHNIDDMYATPAPEPPPLTLVATRVADTTPVRALVPPRYDTRSTDEIPIPGPSLTVNTVDAYGTHAPVRYDTHNIDDMYATPAPELGSAGGRPLEASPLRLPPGTVPRRAEPAAAEDPEPGGSEEEESHIVFDWQAERLAKDKDEIVELIEKRLRRIELQKRGDPLKRPRKKQLTQRLRTRGRREREKESVSFYVTS